MPREGRNRRARGADHVVNRPRRDCAPTRGQARRQEVQDMLTCNANNTPLTANQDVLTGNVVSSGTQTAPEADPGLRDFLPAHDTGEVNSIEKISGLLALNKNGLCDCQVPIVTGLPLFITKDEDFPSGSLLFTFNVAVAVAGEDIVIDTSGADTSSIVYVNQTQGNDIFVQVFTKTVLDRDGNGIPGTDSVDLRFMASDARGNEHFYYGNETYSKVTANDLDSGNNGILGIRYKMESESLASEYRATFTMDAGTGKVTLQRALDYETHKIYHFNVTATDENGNGRTSEATGFTITVLDVQDTPPFFTSGSYKAFVRDNTEVNSLIVTVHALDGDTGYKPLNVLEYSILTGQCSEFFRINNRGEIRTAKIIDTYTQLPCELTVLAQEIDVDPSKQYGSTKTEVTVFVVLENKECHHDGDCSRGTQLNAVMNTCLAAVILPILL